MAFSPTLIPDLQRKATSTFKDGDMQSFFFSLFPALLIYNWHWTLLKAYNVLISYTSIFRTITTIAWLTPPSPHINTVTFLRWEHLRFTLIPVFTRSSVNYNHAVIRSPNSFAFQPDMCALWWTPPLRPPLPSPGNRHWRLRSCEWDFFRCHV